MRCPVRSGQDCVRVKVRAKYVEEKGFEGRIECLGDTFLTCIFRKSAYQFHFSCYEQEGLTHFGENSVKRAQANSTAGCLRSLYLSLTRNAVFKAALNGKQASYDVSIALFSHYKKRMLSRYTDKRIGKSLTIRIRIWP